MIFVLFRMDYAHQTNEASKQSAKVVDDLLKSMEQNHARRDTQPKGPDPKDPKDPKDPMDLQGMYNSAIKRAWHILTPFSIMEGLHHPAEDPQDTKHHPQYEYTEDPLFSDSTIPKYGMGSTIPKDGITHHEHILAEAIWVLASFILLGVALTCLCRCFSGTITKMLGVLYTFMGFVFFMAKLYHFYALVYSEQHH